MSAFPSSQGVRASSGLSRSRSEGLGNPHFSRTEASGTISTDRRASTPLPVASQGGDDLFRGQGRALLPERSQPFSQLPPPDGQKLPFQGRVDHPAALPARHELLQLPCDVALDHEIQLPRSISHFITSHAHVISLPLYHTYYSADGQLPAGRVGTPRSGRRR